MKSRNKEPQWYPSPFIEQYSFEFVETMAFILSDINLEGDILVLLRNIHYIIFNITKLLKLKQHLYTRHGFYTNYLWYKIILK